MSAPRLENDAVARRAHDGDIGLSRVLQAIDRLWPDRERLQGAAGEAGHEFLQDIACGDGRQGQGVDAYISVPTAVEFEDVELDNLVDGGDQDLPPHEGERLMRSLEVRI